MFSQIRNGTNAVVSELEKYSWYNIFVTASTARGDGGKTSKTIKVRTMAGGNKTFLLKEMIICVDIYIHM